MKRDDLQESGTTVAETRPIGAAAASGDVPEQELTSIAEHVARTLDVWECDVYEWDAERRSLTPTAFWSQEPTPADGDWLGTAYTMDEDQAVSAIIMGSDVFEEQLDDPDMSPAGRALLDQWGEKSTLSMPLVYQGETVGCLTLVEKRAPRRFTDEDKHVLRQLAVPAAVAIHDARTRRVEEERGRRLASLLDSIRAVSATVVVEDVLVLVCQKAGEALDVPSCVIWEYDPETLSIVLRSDSDRGRTGPETDAIGTTYPLADYPDDKAILEAGVVVETHLSDRNIDSVTRQSMKVSGEKSCLSVPIIFEGQPLGLLEIVETRYERRFKPEERELAQALGEQAAVAIQNARLFRRLEEQNRRLVALFTASQAIVGHRTADEALAGVAEEVAGLFVERECTVDICVRLPDGDQRRVVHTGAGGPPAADCDQDDELVSAAVAALEPRQAEAGAARRLVTPLVLRGEAAGFLQVTVPLRRPFSDSEAELVQILANQAAAAWDNAQTQERSLEQRDQLAQANRRLNAFIALTEQLRGLVDEADLLEVLGRVMQGVLDFKQWVAYLYNSEAHTFHIAASVGGVPHVEERMIGADVPGRVMSGLLAAATPISQSHFVDSRRHAWTDEEHFWLPGAVEGTPAPDEWQNDDTLLVPMVTDREQLIGYIEAYDPRDRQLPTLETVRLLELFAAQAASSIELHRLYDALAEQARTDGLTGIANHRAFNDRLGQEVATAARYGTPLSLLMIDIDNFKPFNDTYGHPQGDKLLKQMAALLLASTRENVDLVARYGGEEFVVLLPNTPAEGAAHLAERLRGDVSEDERSGLTVAEAIRQAMVQTAFEGSPDKPEVQVTVSVGVASFPDHARSAEELVANSDKALYLAKRLGKNCVELFH